MPSCLCGELSHPPTLTHPGIDPPHMGAGRTAAGRYPPAIDRATAKVFTDNYYNKRDILTILSTLTASLGPSIPIPQRYRGPSQGHGGRDGWLDLLHPDPEKTVGKRDSQLSA